MSKQLKRWTFVYHEPEDALRLSLVSKLKTACGRWCFQLERGDTGHFHWQGRCSFKQPKRVSECAGALGLPADHAYFMPEHDSKAGDFYNQKEETRMDGPWTDKDVAIYIPRQVREMETLRPWQQTIVDMTTVWNLRKVDSIVDCRGNVGKSCLVQYCHCHGLGKLLPFCNDFKDLLRMCYDVGPQPCYFVDMPRAINKDKLNQFYSAIEMIKGGYCYDDRYKFQDRLFDAPRVVVFTNRMPDMELLSKDRWNLWKIVDEQLVPYCEPEIKPDIQN